MWQPRTPISMLVAMPFFQVVSAEIISRIFYGAVLNIEIWGMGVTRALCDRFEHRATEKILARFDFLSDFFPSTVRHQSHVVEKKHIEIG